MMNLNFAPKRDDLAREIEHCITENRVDILDSFCKGCLNGSSGPARPSACSTCIVQLGRELILKQAPWGLPHRELAAPV